MEHDIAAIGNALVDTQFKVEQDFLEEIGMKPDAVSYTHLTLPTNREV